LTIDSRVPVLGFCAYSGTGKTSLLVKLIPLLKARGLRLALLKHAHHTFDIDQPGKDSYELRKAGADQIVIASRHRMACIRELASHSREPQLPDVLSCLDARGLDLILVEGFKHEPIPKIELYRPVLGKPMIHATDVDVIAVASDVPFSPARELPRLDLNAPEEVVGFILQWLEGERGLAAS
jgi:molybdopterin-guanine dinucleotide biosynthesis protein MobB